MKTTTPKKKTTTSAKKTSAKKVAAKKTSAPARRADFGGSIDAWYGKLAPPMRAIGEALHALVMETAPKATASLKWGQPFFELGGGMICAIGAHKSHVNLILPGSPDHYADPKGLLEGTAKLGRHLKLTALADLPRADVKKWLKSAAARAKTGAKMTEA